MQAVLLCLWRNFQLYRQVLSTLISCIGCNSACSGMQLRESWFLQTLGLESTSTELHTRSPRMRNQFGGWEAVVQDFLWAWTIDRHRHEFRMLVLSWPCSWASSSSSSWIPALQIWWKSTTCAYVKKICGRATASTRCSCRSPHE